MTQTKKTLPTPEQQEEMIAAVREVLETKYPYLLDIMEEVRKFPNGVVSLQLRVYNGVVQDVVGNNIWRKTYSKKQE
jgi:hypothetical protein